MSCAISRDQTSVIITTYLGSRFSGQKPFTEESNLDFADELMKRTFSFGIKSRLQAANPDCDRSGFGPDDTSGAGTVKNLVDTVWKALKEKNDL